MLYTNLYLITNFCQIISHCKYTYLETKLNKYILILVTEFIYVYILHYITFIYVVLTRIDLRKLNAPINASMYGHVVSNGGGVVVKRQTWRRWISTADDLEEYNQRDTFFKLGLVQCKGEMVSILNWITASLMTKRRPGRRNTFNAIHKHFYRTSNP